MLSVIQRTVASRAAEREAKAPKQARGSSSLPANRTRGSSGERASGRKRRRGGGSGVGGAAESAGGDGYGALLAQGSLLHAQMRERTR
jgi:hypothetical protein